MRRDELFIKPVKVKPEDKILVAGKGFLRFSDECFVIADGVKSLTHYKEAQTLTAQTAIWAYKNIRERRTYWTEKLALLKRIFRSTNLTLWQKRRDRGFSAGLGSALMVVIVIEKYFWVGSAGNTNCFLYRDGLIDVLTKRDVDSDGMITKAVGFSRKQLFPSMKSGFLLENDCILIASDSVANYVSEDAMRSVFEQSGKTQESMSGVTEQLFQIARDTGSRSDMSACMIKHIVI